MKHSSAFGSKNAFYIGARMIHIRRPKVAFSEAGDVVLNRKGDQ
jgi:hypothetical protein